MGRVKLKIKKLENTNGRQATYAKRKQGIMKKASELSILCDTDIVLLMFSPTGKPSLCKGLRSNIEEVIEKFSQLTPQERTKRKLESLEALKKTFRKVDHDVDIPELLGARNQNIEDLSNQATFLKTKVSEIQKRMIYWTEPDKINNIQHLGQMEKSLRDSLNQIRLCKENIQKQQLMSLECSDRFNEMHVPFRVSSEQQLQPFSWIYNAENPHVVLPEDKKLPVNRDAEFSSSSSYGSHTSYIGTGKSPDISPTSHDHALHQLNRTAPLRFQLGGRLPFLPYSVDLLNDCKIQQATADMNPQENLLNHYFTGSFEAPRYVYGSSHPSWDSTSGHCTIPMPDEHLHTQASFL